MIPLKMPKWFDSIKGITTFLLIATYCGLMFRISHTCCQLLIEGKGDMGKELLVFIIGNFTGTAIGAVMAYFFKQPEPNQQEAGK